MHTAHNDIVAFFKWYMLKGIFALDVEQLLRAIKSTEAYSQWKKRK